MHWWKRTSTRVFFALLALAAGLLLLTWALTWHPPERGSVEVHCAAGAETLERGQTLRVLSWNVQYMASKNYVFFYDLLDGSGPDERPSPEHIAWTFDEVARVIAAEEPDLVLLQEVDDGAARTDCVDQLAILLGKLGNSFPCHASAFYWKASFVPHPRIWGAVGMKLSILSKFHLAEGFRHQLALIPADPVSQQFNLKRAILEVRAPLADGSSLVIFDTHLDAFAQGTDTMQHQVAETRDLLDATAANGHAFIIGGDFNLLPPGEAYDKLDPRHRAYYQAPTELGPFFELYGAVPSREESNGADRAQWFTHFPNDPTVRAPDRTIDYLFFSRNVRLGKHHVRHGDALAISDHLPLIADFTLPGDPD